MCYINRRIDFNFIYHTNRCCSTVEFMVYLYIFKFTMKTILNNSLLLPKKKYLEKIHHSDLLSQKKISI